MDPISGWTAPPARLVLEPGWVHVFRLALDLPAARLAQADASLMEDERQRAARYVREIDRQHFTAARGQLREILANYLGCAPAALRFTYNAYGKPALAEGEPRFNLSHSQGRGLLAVVSGREIGVDVEGFHRIVDYANIARRFFAPSEAADFLALPVELQPQAFFNGWTRKEAYIKARGMGLSIPLDRFEVTLAPSDPPRFNTPEEGWSLYALDAGPDFAAALVVEGEIEGIRCWDWPGTRPGE